MKTVIIIAQMVVDSAVYLQHVGKNWENTSPK